MHSAAASFSLAEINLTLANQLVLWRLYFVKHVSREVFTLGRTYCLFLLCILLWLIPIHLSPLSLLPLPTLSVSYFFTTANAFQMLSGSGWVWPFMGHCCLYQAFMGLLVCAHVQTFWPHGVQNRVYENNCIWPFQHFGHPNSSELHECEECSLVGLAYVLLTSEELV